MNTQYDDHSTTDTVLNVLVIGGLAACGGLALVAHAVLPLIA